MECKSIFLFIASMKDVIIILNNLQNCFNLLTFSVFSFQTSSQWLTSTAGLRLPTWSETRMWMTMRPTLNCTTVGLPRSNSESRDLVKDSTLTRWAWNRIRAVIKIPNFCLLCYRLIIFVNYNLVLWNCVSWHVLFFKMNFI